MGRLYFFKCIESVADGPHIIIEWLINQPHEIRSLVNKPTQCTYRSVANQAKLHSAYGVTIYPEQLLTYSETTQDVASLNSHTATLISSSKSLVVFHLSISDLARLSKYHASQLFGCSLSKSGHPVSVRECCSSLASQ